MHPNADLLHRFYDAFDGRDAVAMVACYHPDATFRDPAFGELDRRDAERMWTVLCRRGEDLSVTHEVLEAHERQGKVRWRATYTFSATGRPVENRVEGSFTFADGLILRHVDDFDFHRWAGQALGLPGKLLGWAPPFRAAVRRKARRGVGIP